MSAHNIQFHDKIIKQNDIFLFLGYWKNFIWTQKRVRISRVKRAISARAIEFLLYLVEIPPCFIRETSFLISHLLSGTPSNLRSECEVTASRQNLLPTIAESFTLFMTGLCCMKMKSNTVDSHYLKLEGTRFEITVVWDPRSWNVRYI